MKFAMPNKWENFVFNEHKIECLLSLKLRLKKELISGKKIYPPEKEIFRALKKETNVEILLIQALGLKTRLQVQKM